MDNKTFPTITLSSQQINEIKDWEIGGTYKLEITVQMIGIRKAESYDLPTQDTGEGSMPHNSVMIANFNIIDVEAEDEGIENVMDKDVYERDYAEKMQSKEVYNDDKVSITINKL